MLVEFKQRYLYGMSYSMVSILACYFRAHFQDISLKQLGQNLQKVLTAVSIQQKVAYLNSVILLIESFRQNLFDGSKEQPVFLVVFTVFLISLIARYTRDFSFWSPDESCDFFAPLQILRANLLLFLHVYYALSAVFWARF